MNAWFIIKLEYFLLTRYIRFSKALFDRKQFLCVLFHIIAVHDY
jgi:hypothetical protein